MKSFNIPQSSYCPLIWMTHSRGLNNKINHIHERALCIIYKHFSTSFEVGISPIIMREIFKFCDENDYNLRSDTHLSRPIVHATHYGTESVANLGAKIRELVPQNIKEASSLSSFNPLNANPTKWSNIRKQFVGISRRIV